LFVDDGSFAVALLVWMVGAAAVLRIFGAGDWGGPVFATGIGIVLAENVLRSAHRRQAATGKERDGEITRHQD